MATPAALYTMGKVAVGAAVMLATTPAVLSVLGFGAAGVTAGSMAAAAQSTMGGFVAKGSLFAICQSWGAAGIPVVVKTAVATVGGMAAALI
ncbi:interferon alpha-inducible protein 27, mitochondrial-like isoform X2 [Amblyomma americanum]